MRADHLRFWQTAASAAAAAAAPRLFQRAAAKFVNGEAAIILRAPRQSAGYLYTDRASDGMAGFFVLDASPDDPLGGGALFVFDVAAFGPRFVSPLMSTLVPVF